MNSGRKAVSKLVALLVAMILAIGCVMTVYAEQSDDNSLSSLGITTEGVTVSPDFQYDHLNYDVVVPAGTTELQLDPVLSNPNATINSVEGTTLTDGAGTVTITTTAPSGAMIAYTLNVTTASDTSNVDPAQAIAAQEAQSDTTAEPSAAGVAAQQAAEAAAAQSEAQPESETEDSRYVKVDKNTLQDAEDTITRLQKDLQVYKDRSHLFSYVIYGLIAACVILLFLLVNLALRKKDIAAELKEMRKGSHFPEDFDDSADVIPQDGWLDDADDGRSAGRKKKKNRTRADVPQYREPAGYPQGGNAPAPGRTPDGRVNAQTSWTAQQVGTPVEPARQQVPYNGYARSQAPQGRPAGKGHTAGGPAADILSPDAAVDAASGRRLNVHHVSDDTRLYQVPSGGQRTAGQAPVPGAETVVIPAKKLSRAEKAAAKKQAKLQKQAEKAAAEAKWKGEKQPQSMPAAQPVYPGAAAARAEDDVRIAPAPGRRPAPVQGATQAQNPAPSQGASQAQNPASSQGAASAQAPAPAQNAAPAQNPAPAQRQNSSDRTNDVQVDMIDL